MGGKIRAGKGVVGVGGGGGGGGSFKRLISSGGRVGEGVGGVVGVVGEGVGVGVMGKRGRVKMEMGV